MSYINLPSVNLADFAKGTISIWFRLSQDSVEKARKHNASYRPPDFGDGAIGPSIFAATIPMVTFGRKVMANNYGFIPHQWTSPAGPHTTTFDSVQKSDSPAEPSHLGLVVDPVRGGLVNEGVYLRMYFQMRTQAQVQGLVTEATNVYWELDASGRLYEQYQVVKDISYIRTGTPEYFEIIPLGFQVSVDQWHHLLVSFDFSTSVDVVALANYTGDNPQGDAIKTVCKFWYAFDDHNKTGQNNMGDSWAYHGPNDVVPVTALQAAYDYVPQSPPISSTGKPLVTGELYDPEYHWTASPLPMNGGPMGFPASADYVDTIYHCEQGEFQFFAGLALDTGVQKNRRAFVDDKGKPVDPADTEKLLGKRPDILLHTTANWQAGTNTGAIGLLRLTEGAEAIIPSGQFTPKGRIDRYTPDPELTEHPTA